MSLRVVFFTRSSRPSGAQMAWRLVQAGIPPQAILVEKRSRMITDTAKKRVPSLFKVGIKFIWKRLTEAFYTQLHFYSRKFLQQRFNSPIYLSIEEWALDHPGIPIYQVEDHNSEEAKVLLRKLQPDVGVLTNTRRIKKEILEIPRHGFFNLHLSLLPQYAGLDSIFWALYHGEREIGVTIHQAVAEIDRGDIVIQRKVSVSPLDNEDTLYEKALWLGTHLMTLALKQLEAGTLQRQPQDSSRASYFSWPGREEREMLKKHWQEQGSGSPAFSETPSVLHLITRMTRGGAQENTLATVLGLQKKGYRVTLVTGPSWGKEGEILSEVLEAGVDVVILPEFHRELRPWKDFFVLLKLVSWFEQHRYDIIHTHTSKAGILGRAAASFTKSSMVIHTPHGHIFHSYFHPWKEKFFLALERRAADWSDRLIALTDREREEHLELGVGSPDKWVTIPSGVDEKHFADKSHRRNETLNKLSIPVDRKIIGFVGRLARVKGAIYLIDAMPRIREEFPQVHCVLVGDGQQKFELERRVDELGLRDCVTFAGHREDVSPFLSIFDVLVVPSLNEGMGRVIVEAGLLHRPVVGTNVGGIPDLIEEGETGLLVERKDSSAIANAVIKLVRNPDLSSRLGARLYEKVLKGFTAEQMVEKIDLLYRELLDRRAFRDILVHPNPSEKEAIPI